MPVACRIRLHLSQCPDRGFRIADLLHGATLGYMWGRANRNVALGDMLGWIDLGKQKGRGEVIDLMFSYGEQAG